MKKEEVYCDLCEQLCTEQHLHMESIRMTPRDICKRCAGYIFDKYIDTFKLETKNEGTTKA